MDSNKVLGLDIILNTPTFKHRTNSLKTTIVSEVINQHESLKNDTYFILG